MAWTRLAGGCTILNTAGIMHAFYGAKHGLCHGTTEGPPVLLETSVKFWTKVVLELKTLARMQCTFLHCYLNPPC